MLSLTPGPAVLYVLSQAIRRGPANQFGRAGEFWRERTLLHALGNQLGGGDRRVLQTILLIKWLGAGYLVYLGLRSFFAKTSVVASGIEC